MYSGSAEFNKLIEQAGGNAIKPVFVFSNFNVESFKSLKYYGGANGGDNIDIGTTDSAYLEVTAYTDKVIANQEFLFKAGMELSGGTIEYAPMGYFTVSKITGTENGVTFTAVDRMAKLEKPYISALTYPSDSAKVLDEICSMCGVTLNKGITTPITISEALTGCTCREVLGYIAGIHGKLAYFDRNGLLNLGWYENTCEIKTGLIWNISKAQDDVTVGKVTLAKDAETTYTSGTGVFGIENSNPYATQAITDSLYNSLKAFKYRPCEISMLDNILIDPTDMLKMTYVDGSVYIIPAMVITHDFSAGETKIKAVAKSKQDSEYSFSGPITQAIDRTYAELLTVNRIVATKVDADWVKANTVTADKIEAVNAEIDDIKANMLTVETADIKYANVTLGNIDTANIDKANIGILFNEVGLIDRATIVDGHITGFLDAVEINANNITAGTLIADRILLKGSENGLLYQLNNLGELTSTNVDTLDGSILTERTVTADKLVAKSITANELDVTNIFGNSAVLTTLTSQQAFINAISTNSVVVGASNTANNALNTVNGLEIGGRNLIVGSSTATVNSNWSQNGWGGSFTTYDSYSRTYKLVANSGWHVAKYKLDSSYAGKTLTLSLKAEKVESETTANVSDLLLVNATGSNPFPTDGFKIKSVEETETGTLYSLFCTVVLNSDAQIGIGSYCAPEGKGLKSVWLIKDIKLELGNKATDWTPAPEDISVENIYTPNTTTIDGGKITTGSVTADKLVAKSITAQQIASGAITTDKLGANAVTAEKLSVSNLNAIAAKIGNFSLDTRLYATATGYINPTTADYKVMKNAFAAGTLSSLYNQNAYWDLDGDGDVDIFDYAAMKNMMWNASYNYQNMAHKKTSAINLEINPSDPYKMIKMSGTNAWGTHVEAYYGLNGMKTPKVVSDGADIGDGGVHCSDDIIAGWGTNNEVSLQSLGILKNRFSLINTGASYIFTTATWGSRGFLIFAYNLSNQGHNGNPVTIYSVKTSHHADAVRMNAITTDYYGATATFNASTKIITITFKANFMAGMIMDLR